MILDSYFQSLMSIKEDAQTQSIFAQLRPTLQIEFSKHLSLNWLHFEWKKYLNKFFLGGLLIGFIACQHLLDYLKPKDSHFPEPLYDFR